MNLDICVYDRSCNKGIKVKLVNTINNKEILFNSINKCLEYLSLNKKDVKFIDNICKYNEYLIIPERW